MLFIAPGAAITPVVYAEMFPTGVRTAGAGFPYALAVAVCGGTAPYLQTWLASSGRGDLFAMYAMVLLLISAFTVWRMPETKDVALD